MAASDESEHVTHYVVWLCVAIFAYIPRHPRHSFFACVSLCARRLSPISVWAWFGEGLFLGSGRVGWVGICGTIF